MIREESQNDMSYEISDSEQLLVNLIKENSNSPIVVKYGNKGIEDAGNLSDFLDYYSEEEFRHLLKSLIVKKILEITSQTCILLCPECGQNASLIILTCPSCGSTKISETIVFRHKKCGYIAPKRDFLDGINLRCPSCNEMIELNDDLDESLISSQSYFVCSECNRKVLQSDVNMICLKCRHKYSPEEAYEGSHTIYRYIGYDNDSKELANSPLNKVSDLSKTDQKLGIQSPQLDTETGKSNSETSTRVIVPDKPKIRRTK